MQHYVTDTSQKCVFRLVLLIFWVLSLQIIFAQTQVVCRGSTHQYRANGDSLSHFLWIVDADYQFSTTSESVIEVTWDLRPGIYRIAVKEQLGSCEGPWVGLDVEVVDNPKRTLPETIELCEGDSVLLDAGIGYSDYRWQDNSMAASFLVRNSGVYWVRTENSCNTRIDSVSVQVYQKPYFTFETPTEVLLGNNVVVRASDPSFVSYNWICDALGNFNAPESPEISFVAKAEITEIQLCVTDIHNCKLSQGLSLHANPVLPEAVVTFSEFTPNRDGVNDAWTVVNLGFYPGNHLTVFGRNGQLVFAAKPYQNDWRGTYLNTETDLPVGAYYFVLELNSCYTLKGNVNIVR